MPTKKPKKAKYTLELFEGVREWYWHARHRNGRIVVDGGEGYKNKRGAQKAMRNFIAGISDGDYEIKD